MMIHPSFPQNKCVMPIQHRRFTCKPNQTKARRLAEVIDTTKWFAEGKATTAAQQLPHLEDHAAFE
jgi:hypothetical protein